MDGINTKSQRPYEAQTIEIISGPDGGDGDSAGTIDIEKSREVAVRIQTGSVWLTKHGFGGPRVPFGGSMQSGEGLELCAGDAQIPRSTPDY